MKRLQLTTTHLALLASLLVSACMKESPELPPDLSTLDPNISQNISIGSLKSLFADQKLPASIDSDLVIRGIISADDRSGNFYQQINLEDETAGICLLIEDGNLYTKYPIGRRVFVRLNGLYIGQSDGMFQIGGPPDSRGYLTGLTGDKIDQHLLPGRFPNDPYLTTFEGLDTLIRNSKKMINRLVKINGVQFLVQDTASSYAELPAVSSGTSLWVEDCTGNKIVIRTSGYAQFQALPVPNGRGSIKGIFSVYQNLPQIIIRDTSDVQCQYPRCEIAPDTTEKTLFFENFNSNESGKIKLPGWTNTAQTGNVYWEYSSSGTTGNPYAKISAFKTGASEVTTWLITPPIDLAPAKNAILSFRSASGYANGATLSVWISENYLGGDPNTATWTQLHPKLAPEVSTGFSSFVSSDPVPLSSFQQGHVHVAFKYEGGDPEATTTFELDDIRITDE